MAIRVMCIIDFDELTSEDIHFVGRHGYYPAHSIMCRRAASIRRVIGTYRDTVEVVAPIYRCRDCVAAMIRAVVDGSMRRARLSGWGGWRQSYITDVVIRKKARERLRADSVARGNGPDDLARRLTAFEKMRGIHVMGDGGAVVRVDDEPVVRIEAVDETVTCGRIAGYDMMFVFNAAADRVEILVPTADDELLDETAWAILHGSYSPDESDSLRVCGPRYSYLAYRSGRQRQYYVYDEERGQMLALGDIPSPGYCAEEMQRIEEAVRKAVPSGIRVRANGEGVPGANLPDRVVWRWLR